MKILLIESDLQVGEEIRTELQELGHEVAWIAGSVLPDVTRGAYNPQAERVALDLTGVKLALINNYLGDFYYDGLALGQHLLQRAGICCVGIGHPMGNRLMEENCAVLMSCAREDISKVVGRFASMMFKTETLPDGPKVGSVEFGRRPFQRDTSAIGPRVTGIALTRRTEWVMPPDADPLLFLNGKEND